jgi:conjugal transfer ATP-binding protein TraC
MGTNTNAPEQPAQNTPTQNGVKSGAQAQQTATINITNTEPKGSPKFGLLESLRQKWTTHVQTNKEKTKTAKEKHDQEEAQMQELFLNFDPKKDKKKLTPSLRKKIVQAEKTYNNGIVSIKDLVAPSSFEVSPHFVKVNGQYAKTFFVYNYPRYLEANWLNPIVNYDVSMDMSLFIYPTESSKMLRILKKKVAEMMSTRSINTKRGQIGDPALDTALGDAEQLRIDLQRGTERFFQVGIYFTVYAEDEKKLKTVSKQIETILGGQLVSTRPADFRMERGFEANLPQATDMLGVTRNMNTAPLSSTFPFVSSSLTSNEGILYGLNRHNNSLIIFDRFKLENANQVVFAKSGAGKSYAVKLDILRSLMMGTDVIVLDPENEYETLTHTIGGTYLKISLNSDQRINPFDLPKPIRDAETRPGDLLRENIISLLGLMNLMLGKMTPYEEGIMDKALLQTYQIKGITPEAEDPTQFEMPTMVDLQNILESMDGGENLAIRLEKYTQGTFSGVFSKQTNVNLHEGLVVFCIRDLEERLRPIAMYIILNYIWNTVRSELKPRNLVVDEAWNIVQHEDSARFLHGLVKRARKYYLGITTITQDVEDFMNSSWGKPIITNSSMQLLLRQAPSAIPLLQQTFHLTEGEKYLLLNSGVGQGLFFAGNQHVAIQIIASYGENKIVTTNPQEILNSES